MSKIVFLLLAILPILVSICQAVVFTSYPSYQTNGWHYDNYGNLLIGNRDNGFYPGPCFGPECPWGK